MTNEKILEEFDEKTIGGGGMTWEEVRIFLSEKLDQALAEERARVMGIIKSNSKGAFTDDGGNNCWYVDDLLSSLANPDKE